MIAPIRNLIRQRQRGAAAVELALLLPILVVFLTVPLFFARYFWHYTVAHKAAHDAASYLSTISVKEMRTKALAQAAGQISFRIASEEIADLNPGRGAPTIEVYCGNPRKACDGVGANALPATVAVLVELDMVDNIFGAVNTGVYGWTISADVEMRYVGR